MIFQEGFKLIFQLFFWQDLIQATSPISSVSHNALLQATKLLKLDLD